MNYCYIASKHAIYDYIRENTSIFSSKGQKVISLDEPRFDDSRYDYHDCLASPEVQVPENLTDVLSQFVYSPKTNMSDKECLVAHLILSEEYKPSEIAKITGMNKGTVCYYVKKIRKKISDYIKSGYFE